MMRGTRRFLIPVLVVAGLAPQLVGGPAHAATSLTATPDLPSSMTVSQAQAVGIDLVNTSTPGAPVTAASVRFTPACSRASDGCQAVDPGHLTDEQRVFVLADTPTGSQACAGVSFVVTQPTPGVYDLAGTFTLAAGQVCHIGFGLEAITTPLVDSNPAVAGVQTTAVVEVVATASGVRAVGTDTVTVDRYTPTAAAWADDPLVTTGTPLAAIAHVLRASPRPGDSVTFRLFGDAACGQQIFTTTVPIDTSSLAIAGYFGTAPPGVYRWTYSYSGDASNNPLPPSPCDDPALTQQVVPGGMFVPLTPARIEDTRLGLGGLSGPLGPGATGEVQVTGRGGIPGTGVSAVVLNVTVTQPSADGWLTLWPAGSARPVASNLNFTAGETIPNLAVVEVGNGGRVDVYNSSGATHVVLDVAGYYTDAPAPAGGYQAVPPSRIADTRNGTGGVARLGPGASIDVQVTGRGGAPVGGVEAAVLNVAVTGATAPSYLTVYPTGEARPGASNLNVVAGDTVSNRAMTKLGTGGRVTIYNAAGSVDVIVDLGGWYGDGSWEGTVPYRPLEPARVLDTRLGLGGVTGPVAAGSTIDLQVTGTAGVPQGGVSAVVLNVTVTQPAGAGWLTLFPSDVSRPDASDLNFAAAETRPNVVVVQVRSDGRVRLYASAQTHVVVDVAGYFT